MWKFHKLIALQCVSHAASSVWHKQYVTLWHVKAMLGAELTSSALNLLRSVLIYFICFVLHPQVLPQ